MDVIYTGLIPDEDVAPLKALGVADVVLQDTPPEEVTRRVREAARARA
jgi:methylmalonyl-CoA mutase C-terminal domain/subunit